MGYYSVQYCPDKELLDIEYFDCIYEELASIYTPISEWRISSVLQDLLVRDSSDQEIQQKQGKWLLHIIDKHAKDESIILLFRAIAETNQELRKMALLELLRINDNIELFEKIPLDPSHWGGNEGEIIPQLTERVDYLESLLRDLNGIRYLKHTKRIRERIELWKDTIKEEEIQMICRRLYR